MYYGNRWNLPNTWSLTLLCFHYEITGTMATSHYNGHRKNVPYIHGHFDSWRQCMCLHICTEICGLDYVFINDDMWFG